MLKKITKINLEDCPVTKTETIWAKVNIHEFILIGINYWINEQRESIIFSIEEFQVINIERIKATESYPQKSTVSKSTVSKIHRWILN